MGADLTSSVAFVSAMEAGSWGGSEELWSQTAAEMRKRGIAVSINVRKWPNESSALRRLENLGCRVTRRNATGFVARAIRTLTQNPFGDWLDSVGNSLVVISQGNNYDGVRWATACLRAGKPYVLIAHVASEFIWPDDNNLELARSAYSNAHACYFVSKGNQELTLRQLAIPLTNARIVRNPFNVPYDASPPWPADDQTLSLACIGRLDPKTKGQDILLDVLRQDKWRSRAVTLTLYGTGHNVDSLKKLAKLWNLQNITFAGHVEDVEQIWRRHHALVLPSRVEGLPIVIVEAMLCARPCIVTDVAGNAEFIRDNVSGFIADAPTTAALDAALDRAWQSRPSLLRIGLEAAKDVRQFVPRDPAHAFASELIDDVS